MSLKATPTEPSRERGAARRTLPHGHRQSRAVAMPSVPPPSAGPPPSAPTAPELAVALEAHPGDELRLGVDSVSVRHGRVLQRAARAAARRRQGRRRSTPGPRGVRAVGPLRRSCAASARRRVIPRTEGIEGWLWTSTGGTGLTNLGEDDEAPNVALVFTKPLDEARAARRVRPRVRDRAGRALAARQPDRARACCSASPTRSPPSSGFRRWGFQSVLTDKEVPPTLRRHLPTDQPADPVVPRRRGRRARGHVGARRPASPEPQPLRWAAVTPPDAAPADDPGRCHACRGTGQVDLEPRRHPARGRRARGARARAASSPSTTPRRRAASSSLISIEPIRRSASTSLIG